MIHVPSVALPGLDLEAWEPTKMTVHLYLQIVGKIQLALMPRKNHWWNITFLLNSKGLVTHTIPADDFTFEIQFNFLEHHLEIITSKGISKSFPLTEGLSVAEFYQKIFSLLGELGITPKIIAHPYDWPDKDPVVTPFADLHDYNSYDAAYVSRFWRVLVWVDSVFREFSGRFYGKTSPSQLFWHHFDLAVTRFCGRRAPDMPPGSNIANKDAYSHELISFGFWFGDSKVRNAAFYSYTYPSPPGIDHIAFKGYGKWVDSNGSPMALLSYDDLLREHDPHAALLDFLEQCYQSGATLAKWDITDMTVTPLEKM